MKYLKIITFLLLVLLISLAFSANVFADFGPKPSTTVIVNNPPDGVYYLDLLVNYDGNYKNLNEKKQADYDQSKLKILQDYKVDGWFAGLSHGTNAPMVGTLTGVNKDGIYEHTFRYIVPETYKVIIVTPDNEIKVSQVIHKKLFNDTVVIDYDTMEVSILHNLIILYAKQYSYTFISTILIEGLILLLFGFSTKKNWIVFIITNFITQLFMTLLLGQALIKLNTIAILIAFMFIELVIFTIEAIIYSKMFENHSCKRRIAYAITANLISVVIGILMIS